MGGGDPPVKQEDDKGGGDPPVKPEGDMVGVDPPLWRRMKWCVKINRSSLFCLSRLQTREGLVEGSEDDIYLNPSLSPPSTGSGQAVHKGDFIVLIPF